MARVRKPKSFVELLKNIPADIFVPLTDKYLATDHDGRYLHWDRFQWYVKKGDSTEAAWLATKFARKSISKTLALLVAEKDKVFSYCIPDSLFAKLHYIDKITGGGHAIGDSLFVSKNIDKDRYLVKSLMMEEAITSSHLEGAVTTRKVAKEMLESHRDPKNKSEQMIFNNFLLMKKAVEKKNEPLSIELILELHEIATFNAIDNDAIAGEFRQDDNITVSDLYNEIAHTPPSYKSLKDRINSLCEFANLKHDGQDSDTFIHPIVKAIILHFMLSYIHPFGDGNGRTARAIFYWYMLKSQYWLFEYVSISKLIKEKRSDYDKAFIYTETDEFDLTYFIYNQVDIVIKAINALNEHIEAKKRDFYDFMQWMEKSPLSKKLKKNQLEILKIAIKEPGKIFTSKSISIEFDLNENTARSYLNKLVDEDLLIATKAKKGKAILYIAPANLKEILKL